MADDMLLIESDGYRIHITPIQDIMKLPPMLETPLEWNLMITTDLPRFRFLTTRDQFEKIQAGWCECFRERVDRKFE